MKFNEYVKEEKLEEGRISGGVGSFNYLLGRSAELSETIHDGYLMKDLVELYDGDKKKAKKAFEELRKAFDDFDSIVAKYETEIQNQGL